MSTLSRAALAVLLLMMLWALVPPALGMRSTVVMTGSMTPAVQVGDVVVTRTPDPSEVGLGTVLLVEDPDHGDRLRLHRLVGVEDGMLRLQGDANGAPDSTPVSPDEVRGLAFLRVPFVGLPILWAQTGDWTAVTLASGAVSGLLLGAGTSRLLPSVVPSAAKRRRRTAVVGGAAAVLLALASDPSPAPAWAAFTAVTGPSPTTFASGSFDCLSALRGVDVRPPTLAYAFGETSGDVADLIVNANPGKPYGSVERVRGSCVKNDRPSVRFGTSGKGAVVSSTQVASPYVFTLAVWFKASAGGGVLAGFGSSPDAGASSTSDRQLVVTSTGALTFRLGVVGGVTASVTTPSTYLDDQWHQAVVVMTGALSPMSIYVDGGLARSASLSLGLGLVLLGTPAYLRLGYDSVSGSTAEHYRGLIGYTALWNGSVLSDVEIVALAAAGH